MSATDWRERLLDRMPPDLAEEIDIFEGQMELPSPGSRMSSSGSGVSV